MDVMHVMIKEDEDISYSALQLLIEFIYCRSIQFTTQMQPQLLQELYHLAERFQIELLMQIIMGNIHLESLKRLYSYFNTSH